MSEENYYYDNYENNQPTMYRKKQQRTKNYLFICKDHNI